MLIVNNAVLCAYLLLCPFLVPDVSYFFLFPFMSISVAVSLFYSSFQITSFYVCVRQCSLSFLISLLLGVTVFFRLLHHLDFLWCKFSFVYLLNFAKTSFWVVSYVVYNF